jgi:alkylation response protein AidB-like acyl-CoA dehydrogenase
MNGPNWGKDVFIPMDWVVGGKAYAGQGWRMLMECLAAGRAISLPSSTTGGAKTAVRTTGAYSRVRNQFRVPIGKFEGVEEALARMGGNLYSMEAAGPNRGCGGSGREAPQISVSSSTSMSVRASDSDRWTCMVAGHLPRTQ